MLSSALASAAPIGGTNTQLNDSREAAVFYAAQGFRPSKIISLMPALRLNTLKHWRKQQWWVDAIQRATLIVAGNPAIDTFAPRLPQALEAIDRALEPNANAKLQLLAAKEVFTRIYGRAVEANDNSGTRNTQINIYFSDRPD